MHEAMHNSIRTSGLEDLSGLKPLTPDSTLLERDSSPLKDKNVLVGMGAGKEGVPIDNLTLLLSAKEAGKIDVVITDEFLKFNGLSDVEVERVTEALQSALLDLAEIYGLPIAVTRCSEFMDSARYKHTHEEVLAEVLGKGLDKDILELVPERHRHKKEALEYPLHEAAVVLFMSRAAGTEIKLGPNTERKYDAIIEKAGVPVDFAYSLDALPVATNKPTPVVHYISGHRAKGSRLMLSADPDKVAAQIEKSHPAALRYLCELGAEAGRCLW